MTTHLVDLLELLHHRMVADADGWCVATVDPETLSVLSVTGPFSTPEAALIEAGRMDTIRDRDLAEDEAKPRHEVVPMWRPSA